MEENETNHSNLIRIRIINWDKNNKNRKDVKFSSWFKFKHDFFDQEQFFDLTHEEKLFWIYLLCEYSKQNGLPETQGWLTVNTLKADRISGFNENTIHHVIKKLEQLRLVEVCASRARNVDVTRTSRARNVDVRKAITKKQKSVSEKNNETDAGLELRREIWKTYTECYEKRYHTKPVGNAMTAKQVQYLANRLGKEAVDVVEFYLQHNKAYYTERCHPIGLCLSDAESLRTQWSRGRAILTSEAKNFERKQANTNVFDEAIRILNERKSGEQNE